MGYRSVVALVIHKTHEQAMLADNDIAQVLSEVDKKLEDDESLLFFWEDTKWYSDDKEISALMAFLSNIDDCDDYLFIRLGESDDDTEIEGSWWNNPFEMGYARRIEFNDPSKPSAQIADLKSQNTRADATNCAHCGRPLNDPGMGPLYKHCPICEP
jgi:hypothetical protein